MSFSFLIVLPKETRSIETPVAWIISISPRLAVSNLEPAVARRANTCAAGLAFTA
jgi:hypothetical protein